MLQLSGDAGVVANGGQPAVCCQGCHRADSFAPPIKIAGEARQRKGYAEERERTYRRQCRRSSSALRREFPPSFFVPSGWIAPRFPDAGFPVLVFSPDVCCSRARCWLPDLWSSLARLVGWRRRRWNAALNSSDSLRLISIFSLCPLVN